MGSDEQAVREAHAAWIAAVNAGDLEQLLGAMAPDVVFVAPGEDPNGRDEFRARFSGAHDEYRIHCVSELDDVVVVGEVAYTLARDSLSVTPRSGGRRPRSPVTGSASTGSKATGAGSSRATSTRWSPARNEGAVRSLARQVSAPRRFDLSTSRVHASRAARTRRCSSIAGFSSGWLSWWKRHWNCPSR